MEQHDVLEVLSEQNQWVHHSLSLNLQPEYEIEQEKFLFKSEIYTQFSIRLETFMS